MNFIRFDDSITYNKNNSNKFGHNPNFNYTNNNHSRSLNYIYHSNNKLFQKELTPEKENDSSNICLTSLKKEIYYKLSSYSQEDQKVKFSSGIEEIYDENKNDIFDNDNKLFFNISNKKFSTPPRNTKSSYKKTKEHIKTPYRTTKSNSTRNKGKINKEKDKYKSILSCKSSNFWKSLFSNEDMMNDNIAKDMDIDINRNCNSIILENPYFNKKEYRIHFCNISHDNNEEDLNKSF